MFQLAFCDDEPAFRESIRQLLSRAMNRLGISAYQLDEYVCAADLIRAVSQGKRYHILFLDIVLEREENGIEAARRLRDVHDVRSSIIFITNREQFAVESFSVSPDNFLTKPVSLERLEQAVAKSLKRWEEDATIPFTGLDKRVRMLRLGDISYIEVYDKVLVVHTRTQTIHCLGKLEEVAKSLPEPRFFRSQRSYLVNLDHVEGLGRRDFIMEGGDVVPIAQRRYAGALQAFARHKGVFQ